MKTTKVSYKQWLSGKNEYGRTIQAEDTKVVGIGVLKVKSAKLLAQLHSNAQSVLPIGAIYEIYFIPRLNDPDWLPNHQLGWHSYALLKEKKLKNKCTFKWDKTKGAYYGGTYKVTQNKICLKKGGEKFHLSYFVNL